MQQHTRPCYKFKQLLEHAIELLGGPRRGELRETTEEYDLECVIPEDEQELPPQVSPRNLQTLSDEDIDSESEI